MNVLIVTFVVILVSLNNSAPVGLAHYVLIWSCPTRIHIFYQICPCGLGSTNIQIQVLSLLLSVRGWPFELILVHQNFAGKLHLHFYNIWDCVKYRCRCSSMLSVKDWSFELVHQNFAGKVHLYFYHIWDCAKYRCRCTSMLSVRGWAYFCRHLLAIGHVKHQFSVGMRIVILIT